MATDKISLKVVLPHKVLWNDRVAAMTAEGSNGYFGIQPRHQDFISDIVPGILIVRTDGGRERFMALDDGLLVKRGSEVTVAAVNGVLGDSLERLRRTVREEFLRRDEKERKSRSVLSMLEGAIIRRVGGGNGHGEE